MRRFIAKLNKAVLPFVVAVALLLCFVSPLTASAEKWYDPIDYRNLDYTVKYGTDVNTVTVPLPVFHYYFNICHVDAPNTIIHTEHSVDSITYNFVADEPYLVRIYPAGSRGLLLDHIPVGSKLSFDIRIDVYTYDGASYYPYGIDKVSYYMKGTTQTNRKTVHRDDTYISGDVFHAEYTIEDVAGATSFVPSIMLNSFVGADSSVFVISLGNVRLDMDIDSSYWLQWETQQNGEKLDKLENNLKDVQTSVEGIYDALNGVNSNINGNINSSKNEILGALDDHNNSVVNGTPEMDSIAQNSNQNLSNSSNKLNSLGDQLAAVNKPNVDNIKPSAPADIVTDPNAGVLLSAPITSLWQNKVILGIITTVLTLVLLSWVFFGKK